MAIYSKTCLVTCSRFCRIGSHMLLEQHAFQILSWCIFNLECFSKLLMVQDHKVLMVQDMVLDHELRPKLQKSILPKVYVR